MSQSKAFECWNKAFDWLIIVKYINLTYASQIVTKRVELDMKHGRKPHTYHKYYETTSLHQDLKFRFWTRDGQGTEIRVPVPFRSRNYFDFSFRFPFLGVSFLAHLWSEPNYCSIPWTRLSVLENYKQNMNLLKAELKLIMIMLKLAKDLFPRNSNFWVLFCSTRFNDHDCIKCWKNVKKIVKVNFIYPITAYNLWTSRRMAIYDESYTCN